MKTFNKVIRGKDVKVKFLIKNTTQKLEDEVNEWLSCNDVELISIEFNTTGSCIRCFIMYKI
jgi:hypothetical protein